MTAFIPRSTNPERAARIREHAMRWYGVNRKGTRVRHISRHTTVGLPDGQREELVAWIRSLGLDPDNYAAPFAISEDADGWNLHLCERQLDAAGDAIIDNARNEVATLPRVIQLGPNPSWPGWMNPASS